MTTCWILTEGIIGTQNPCVALAEASGLTPEIKIIKLKQPWKIFTPWIRHFSPAAIAPGSSDLQAPWPDVLIAAGRKAIAAALWIKKQSGNRTKLVIVLSPVVKDKNFDLVVAPSHDNYQAVNALQTVLSLSLLTPQKLAEAKEEWRDRLEKYPSPRISVLIGGTSRTHQLTMDVTKRLAAQLQPLTKNASLFITASRRTAPECQDYLRQHVTGENVFFWDGTGDNPYRGFLSWADILLVTEDSVSMGSEAVSTGKPVYILKLEGGSSRFKRFHDNLVARGYARWFEGQIDHWAYTPPQDLQNAADAVRKLIAR